MRWDISRQSNHPTRVEFLGFGDEITSNTLSKMKDIINSSFKNYYVRRWAEKIIDRAGEGDLAKAQAVYDFLSVNTNYVKDPLSLELLKTPPVSLQLIEAGERPGLDCDDLTILSMSLLKSIGFRVGMRAVGYRKNGEFSHVYGMVFIKPHGWIPFDLVRDLGLGNEAPYMKYQQRDVEV